ncbi:hypothetical protein [Nannocystis pusilla]|uniref:hypothetical protein n=1 Tax=Nannocystis pusilla TaxID=889268 RepID=UPI003DA31329
MWRTRRCACSASSIVTAATSTRSLVCPPPCARPSEPIAACGPRRQRPAPRPPTSAPAPPSTRPAATTSATRHPCWRAPTAGATSRPTASSATFGAGPAAFAAILKAAAPHLQVHAAEVTYKDPAYLAATAADLRAESLDVVLHAVNVLHEPLPPEIDLLTANRLFSGLDRHGAEGWAARLHAALAPGGTLAMVDFFATGDPAHDRSLAALVAQWMAWNRHELQRVPLTDPSDDRHAWGWNPPWRCDELARLLARVGFHDIRTRSVAPPFALVEARK